MAALSDAMAFCSSSPSWYTFSKCDKAKGDFGFLPISTAAAQKYSRADGVSLNKAFNFGVTRSNSLARIRLSTSNSRQEVASLSVGVCSKNRASTEGWFCTSTSIITCVLVSISASFAATRCKASMAKRSSPPLPTLAKISAIAASVRWLFATAARWMAVRPCSPSRGCVMLVCANIRKIRFFCSSLALASTVSSEASAVLKSPVAKARPNCKRCCAGLGWGSMACHFW